MMSRRVSREYLALVALMLVASASSASFTWKASLSGAAVVPPVATKATGSVSITLVNKSYATGYFYATNIKQMTMAHLHAGAAGSNGPVIVWAFNASYGPVSGSVKASFSFNPSEKNISALIAARRVYFNIHTTAYPAGELRGQPLRLGASSPAPLPDGSYKETCLSVDEVTCETYEDPWTQTTWLFCGACIFNDYDYIYTPQDLDLSTCAQPPYVTNDVSVAALTCNPSPSPPPPPPPSPPLPCKYRGESCSSDQECCWDNAMETCPQGKVCCLPVCETCRETNKNCHTGPFSPPSKG